MASTQVKRGGGGFEWPAIQQWVPLAEASKCDYIHVCYERGVQNETGIMNMGRSPNLLLYITRSEPSDVWSRQHVACDMRDVD